jgi:multiple sugar transport system permease protein
MVTTDVGRNSLTPTRSRGTTRKEFALYFSYLLLIPLSLIFILPLVWMISTSLKGNEQMTAWPPVWVPSPIHWENFVTAWTSSDFARYLWNTVMYTVLAGIGTVLTSSMVAFGFARLRFPGRDFLFGLLLATLMLPSIVTLIPQYILFKQFNWLDSFKPLIVPAWFGGGPFFIFLLRQFFRTIPNELFEQAIIDGASSYRAYWQIMLPLAKPALSTVAIFSFLNFWNDFMGPLIYLNSAKKYTLTLGLRTFMQREDVKVQEMMAMSLMMTIPVVILFFAFQRYFIEGVVMSGIKG